MDRERVGIQIEHAAHPGDDVQQSRWSDGIHAECQRVPGAWVYFQPAGLAVEQEGSAVNIAVNGFHARDRALGKEAEQRVIVVGRAKAQLQRAWSIDPKRAWTRLATPEDCVHTSRETRH